MTNDDPWSNPRPLTDLDLAELGRLATESLFEQMRIEHELIERMSAVEQQDGTTPVSAELLVQEVQPVRGDVERLPAHLFGGPNPRG